MYIGHVFCGTGNENNTFIETEFLGEEKYMAPQKLKEHNAMASSNWRQSVTTPQMDFKCDNPPTKLI